MAEDGEKKYSARLNADYQALDFLKFETNMAYEKRDIVNPSTDVGAGYFDPWFWPIWNENGDVYDTFSGSRNPVGGLTQGGQNKNSLTTFRGGLKATLDFPNGDWKGLPCRVPETTNWCGVISRKCIIRYSIMIG